MHIEKIHNTNFNAGLVELQNLSVSKIRSYDAIRKIAEDKGVDLFIVKADKFTKRPDVDIYMVMATKEYASRYKNLAAIGLKRFSIGDYKSGGTAYTSINKTADISEVSVKVYNAAMNAINNLENKVKNLLV